ncbi:hypothetical protein ACJ9E6_002291 [Providencia rettgeri]
MGFKHTPAPWIIIDGDDYFNITAKSTESSPNYMPLLDSDSVGMIEMRANAHLIAAVPELLSELIRLRNIVASYKQDSGDNLDITDAVITRALGQQ